MGRAPCCEKVGLKKGPWTAEEDEKLTAYINQHGHGSWRALPKKAGLLRCGKSCRLRWTNYLRPDIKRGEFSAAEEQTIIQLHALLGNRWSAIASHLPKRTDNEIKNYWNTHLKKRLLKMGIDPMTHKPTSPTETASEGQKSGVGGNCRSSSSSGGGESAGVSASVRNHMAQWESVRLEAEARLAREAEMRAKGTWPQQNNNSWCCHDHQQQQQRQEVLCCSGTMSEEMRKRIEEHTNSMNQNNTTTISNSKSMRTLPSAMDLLNEIQSYCWKKKPAAPPPPVQQQEEVAWADSCYLASSSSSSSSLAHQRQQQQQQPGSPTSTLSSLDHTSLTQQQPPPHHHQQQQQQKKKTMMKIEPPPALLLSSSSSSSSSSAAAAVITTTATTTSSTSSRFKKLSWTDTLLRPLPPSSSTNPHICCAPDDGIPDFIQAHDWRDGSAHSSGDASAFHPPYCNSSSSSFGALFHAQRKDAQAAQNCTERPSAADDDDDDSDDEDNCDDDEDDDGNGSKSCGADTSFSCLHALMQIGEQRENNNEEDMEGEGDAGEEEIDEEDEDDNCDREEEEEEEEEDVEEEDDDDDDDPEEERSPEHVLMQTSVNNSSRGRDDHHHHHLEATAAASEDMSSSSCTSLQQQQQEEQLLHRSVANGAGVGACHDLNSNHHQQHHHDHVQQQQEEEEDEDMDMAGFHYGVISYSALLNNQDEDEDDECYWNSMLKEVEDSDYPILSSI